jgi:hypothetical protein
VISYFFAQCQDANMAPATGAMGSMANEQSRGERLQIMLNAEELTVLDDFRFKNRMPSRAAAVRELLKRGLAAEGFEASPFGTKSEDYGVTGADPKGRKTQ